MNPGAVPDDDISRGLSSRYHNVSCCCIIHRTTFKFLLCVDLTSFLTIKTFNTDYEPVLSVMVLLMPLPQLISVIPDILTCNNIHPHQKSLRVYLCSYSTFYSALFASCLEVIKFIPSYLLHTIWVLHGLLTFLLWIKRLCWIFFSILWAHIYSPDTRGLVCWVFLTLVLHFSVKISHWRRFQSLTWE